MKRVLIIEDDNHKAERAKQNIGSILDDRNESVEFLRVDCMNEFRRLEQELNTVDLIVLDMNFPMYKVERAKIGIGNIVLHRLEARNYHIPVIVYTSELSLLTQESDNIIGKIEYNASIYDKSKFEEIINEYFDW